MEEEQGKGGGREKVQSRRSLRSRKNRPYVGEGSSLEVDDVHGHGEGSIGSDGISVLGVLVEGKKGGEVSFETRRVVSNEKTK